MMIIMMIMMMIMMMMMMVKVSTPKYKWGSVTHRSVGLVSSISPNLRDLTVDFPTQCNWTGLLAEMELVPSFHLRDFLHLSSYFL